MLAKCANPSCSTPLVYLREGKIFMMDHAPETPSSPEAPKTPKPASRVEHFWLCGPCSAEYTLVYRVGMGVHVEPKPHGARRAAA